MVTNSCSFTAPAGYPDVYMAGLAVEGLGNSSVRSVASVLGAFGCIEPFQVSSWTFPLIDPSKSFLCDPVQGHDKDDSILDKVDDLTITTGNSTHVFVDPGSGKPTPIPGQWREGLQRLMVE